jgi:hypothetical protein
MRSSAAWKGRAVLGGALILIAEISVLAGWIPLSLWTTPICWWGYLLVLDALLEKRTGRSPFFVRPGRLAGRTVQSILFWLIFEAYNLRLRNWEYVGLPADPMARWCGYLASFATILPGIFLTTSMLRSFGVFERKRCRPLRIGPRGLFFTSLVGIACLAVPLLVPSELGRYLFAPVWVGVILLLEPINFRLGSPSLLRDLGGGEPGRLLRLLLAGYLCGLLWEFWNYWAAAKWIYHVPFLPQVRIFEMPVLGFLGFGPFALEYYAMHSGALCLWQALKGKEAGQSRMEGISL